MEGLDVINIKDVANTVGSIANTTNYIVGFALIVGIILLFVHLSSFNITFRVKEMINGRKIIKYTQAKIVREKDGSVVLKLKNFNPFDKNSLPAPPDDAIEINSRGKKCVEAYKTSTGDYIYLRDKSKLPEMPKEIMEIADSFQRYQAIKKWKQENSVVDAYEPITSNQRMFFIGQIRKAHEKKQRTLMELIRDLAPLMALTLMFVCLLLFWGKAVEPFREMADKTIQLQTEQTAYVKEIRALKQDIQVISEEVRKKNGNEQNNNGQVPN